MVTTRRMYKGRETQKRTPKQKYRTPEQKRQRRKVLLECMDMLRDGVVKFQKDLDDAHKTYERNIDAILKQPRAGVGAQRADAADTEPPEAGAPGAGAPGAGASTKE